MNEQQLNNVMRIRAGLVPCNTLDIEGNLEWIGNATQWRLFEKLLAESNN